MQQLIAFIKGCGCAAIVLAAIDAFEAAEVMPFIWIAAAMLSCIVGDYAIRFVSWRRANAKLLSVLATPRS